MGASAMTPRARRRIALLAAGLAVTALLATGGLLLHGARVAAQSARALEAGLAAERAGDYPAALKNLSLYCGRNHTDAEAVLALARVRLKVPEVNNRHL